MSTKTKKRLISALLCVVMLFGLMPTTVLAAQQEISAVVATSSNLETIPTLYGSLKIPTFNITQGAPAYITASDANLRWQKNIGGVWTNQNSGRFTPGEWRISTALRLDNEGALQYDFAQNLTFKVNGVSWTVETPNNHGEYSYAWVYSPSFTIVDDPNVQPPIAVESVHMVLNGYTPGAAAASATVTTDANVTVEVLGFLVAIDSNGDGQPDALEQVMGNFASGEMYVVALQIKAKPGYDISGLTMEKVTLDRAITPLMGQYNSEDDVFSDMYILSDAKQYTVNFETNGGSAIQPVLVGGGGVAKEPAAPTKAYYAFAGWYSDEELTKPFDFANTPIIGDITLYAKWTPSPVGGMFLMTIDLNGGTYETPSPLIGEIPANETMYFIDDLNGFVIPPSGKMFAGYEINGVPYNPETGHLVTENFTLKLMWKDAPVVHTCNIKPVSELKASCTASGKKAYFKCDGCGKVFEDALGAKEITDLAAWGNIEKLGHTASDWKSDKDNHWKECTVANCGIIIENSKSAHKDENKDGKCDTCEYNVGATQPDNNTNKPAGGTQSPQTGDSGFLWLLIALMLVYGSGAVATVLMNRKKVTTE